MRGDLLLGEHNRSDGGAGTFELRQLRRLPWPVTKRTSRIGHAVAQSVPLNLFDGGAPGAALGWVGRAGADHGEHVSGWAELGCLHCTPSALVARIDGALRFDDVPGVLFEPLRTVRVRVVQRTATLIDIAQPLAPPLKV